jgi:hypothetical protein
MEKASASKNSNSLRERKPFFQAKLTVGPTDDVYEKEADAMADKVMRVSNHEETLQSKPKITTIQRNCAACEKEEEERAQRKESGEAESEAPSIVHDVIHSGGGNKLDTDTRGFMENRFGYDFSSVKIHNNTVAAKSAQSINALAYTSGNNIVFNQGEYSPGTDSGKKLLAHELTHVVQQDHGGAHKKIQRVTDASFEGAHHLDQAIANGTMTADGIMGQAYTGNCFGGTTDLKFAFSKAYKGIYPYGPTGQQKGVYVKIEVSRYDAEAPDHCTPLRLLQTVRNTQRGSLDALETAAPADETRRVRSGWGDPSAPSAGWRIDTSESAVDPFYSSLADASVEGSDSTPAILYEAPGHPSGTINAGKDFNTCGICQTRDGARWVLGCVNWGYYIDSIGNIVFLPATPAVTCGSTPELQHASERWDSISGHTHTEVYF